MQQTMRMTTVMAMTVAVAMTVAMWTATATTMMNHEKGMGTEWHHHGTIRL